MTLLRTTLLGIFLTLAVCAAAVSTEDWVSVAARVQRSIVFINTEHDTCSGFVISQKRAYVLTAAHCIPDDRLFNTDGVTSYVTFYDQVADLAVVVGPGAKPALHPSRNTPRKGSGSLAMGFAYGFGDITLKDGVISSPELNLGDENGGVWTTFSFAGIPGMSGGPIVDRQGRVVSVVGGVMSSGRTDAMGFGRPLDVILRLTGAYWD